MNINPKTREIWTKILAVTSLVSILLLPFISLWDNSENLLTFFSDGDDKLFQRDGAMMMIGALLNVWCCLFAVIFAFARKPRILGGFSIAGVCTAAMSIAGVSDVGVIDPGMGLFLTLIANGVNIFLVYLKNPTPPPYNPYYPYPPNPYGAPPNPYGAPPNPYGAPPNPYGAPQNPYDDSNNSYDPSYYQSPNFNHEKQQ